jgi:hypothetical protein
LAKALDHDDSRGRLSAGQVLSGAKRSGAGVAAIVKGRTWLKTDSVKGSIDCETIVTSNPALDQSFRSLPPP